MLRVIKEYKNVNRGAFFSCYKTDEVIFFDIETTGFSANYSSVYLIGAIYHKKGHWIFEQLFAENLSEEIVIMKVFFQLISSFKYIVHYNGDTFDIPYLNKKATFHNIHSPLSDIVSIDILKCIRPYQTIFNLDNCKQKTVESFLGLSRNDIYSGGELINQYYDYCKSQRNSLKDNILLHNEEDVYGLIELIKIYDMISFLNNLKDIHYIKSIQSVDFVKERLLLSIEVMDTSPISIEIKKENWICQTVKESSVIYFKINIIKHTMYHYFSNYKEYYYLVDQDEAIHKSLGIFLPKEKRKPAKASNCYIKKTESFLQVMNDCIDLPIFKESKSSRGCFIVFDYNEWENNHPRLMHLVVDFFKSLL